MDVNKPQRSIPAVPNNTDRILVPKKRTHYIFRIMRILEKCKHSRIKTPYLNIKRRK